MFLPIHEMRSRSLAKALSWRILGSLDTFVVAYLVTGKVVLAVSVGGIETVTKTLLYYAHERLWASVPLGRTVLRHEAATHANPLE